MEQIIRSMHGYERFMLQKPENMRRSAEKAEEFGANPGSRMYIHAVRIIFSMGEEVWELKLGALRSLGFSEGDILSAFSACPQAFNVSVKKMREVRNVLVSSGKYDVESIVKNPICFTHSINKRYKPRLQVLAALEHKKSVEKWPSLSLLGGCTDMYFFTKFVAPYIDEVGHLFDMKCSTSTSGKSVPVP